MGRIALSCHGQRAELLAARVGLRAIVPTAWVSPAWRERIRAGAFIIDHHGPWCRTVPGLFIRPS